MSLLNDDILPGLILIAKSALTGAGYGDDLDNRVRLRPTTAFSEEETPGIALFNLSVPREKTYGGKGVVVRVTCAVIVSQQHKAINDERDAPDVWRTAWQIAAGLEDAFTAGLDLTTGKCDGISVDEIREVQEAGDLFTARLDLPLTISLRLRDAVTL